MSQQEKRLGIGVLVLGGLLAIYFIIVGPYLTDVADTDTAIANANKAIQANQVTLNTLQQKQKIMQMIKDNGLKTNPEVTAFQTENALLRWVSASGVNAVERRRAATTDLGGYEVLSYTQTMQASMRTLAQLVYQVEATNLPIRLTQLDIKPVKDGLDQMNVTMSVAALAMPGKPQAGSTPTVLTNN